MNSTHIGIVPEPSRTLSFSFPSTTPHPHGYFSSLCPPTPSGLSLGPFCVCYASGVFSFYPEAICSIEKSFSFPKSGQVDILLSQPLLSLSARGCKKAGWTVLSVWVWRIKYLPSSLEQGAPGNELILEWPHKGSVSRLASVH